jgi:hypothetical protein
MTGPLEFPWGPVVSTEDKPMFIDDLLIGFILCGLVISVIYVRVDLMGSRRQ